MSSNSPERSGRRGLLVVGLLAVVALIAAGMSAIAAVRRQQPGSAHAPRLQTTAVIRTMLAATSTFSGTVGFSAGQTISDASGGTITALPAAGTTVDRGQPLYWVDDQPVVVFYGASALFRTLSLPRAPSLAPKRHGPPAGVIAAQETLQSARRQVAADRLTVHQAMLQQRTSGRATVLAAGEQLSADRSALAQARSQLAGDERLGCPAASSATVGGSSTPAGSGAGGSGSGGSTTAGSSAPTTARAMRRAHDATGTQTDTTGTTTETTTTTTTTTPPPPVAPSVTDEQDGAETTTTATLSAEVSPGGADTHYYFEYGTSASFGSVTPTADAGDGTDPAQVSALLTGLAPGTTYVFSIVAANAHGTVTGVAQTFTTAPSSCVQQRQTIVGDIRALAQDRLALRGAAASAGAGAQTDRQQLRSDLAVERSDAVALRRARQEVSHPHRRVAVVPHGADVALVAQNLAALGFYSGPTSTPDLAYTPALAAAVRRWQASVGIDPTGRFAPDQVVILPGPARVSAIHGFVGGHANDPMLSLSGTTKLVSFSGSGDLRPGEAVSVHVSGHSPVSGRILSVTPDGTKLAARAAVADPGALPATGSADVTVTTERRANVLAVPLEALVALPSGRYALQLPGGYRFAVRVGLIVGDRAEVSAGALHAGMQVVTAA